MEKAGPENPLQEDLGEILTAARRSAEITRQLLAFARRQPVAPKVLDLNETVEGMLKMLRRLIGEDIELRWIPGTKLWPIKIDPSQLDQILANLCVNARDAIAGVGKITIKTDNVIFDPEACNGNADIVPGEYILMSVADNGCGMDEDTRGHLFKPFFTTKEPGRGTGLGLATVYGIVRQNEGFITVYSELERGSTFNIHLPRFAGEVEKKEAEVTADIPRGNGEMLLMVEDEAAILKLGRAMLESLGYRVLTASGAAEAIALAGTHAGRIQLLVTDVVMPEMDGWNLAARLQAMDPNLRVLFISGYMGDRTEAQQVLENGGDFIRKPFSMPLLATKISEVLAKKTIFKIGIVSDAGKAWPR
jgi:CheY-like chemotaxis protein